MNKPITHIYTIFPKHKARKWRLEIKIENRLNWTEEEIESSIKKTIIEDLPHYIGFDKVEIIKLRRLK